MGDQPMITTALIAAALVAAILLVGRFQGDDRHGSRSWHQRRLEDKLLEFEATRIDREVRLRRHLERPAGGWTLPDRCIRCSAHLDATNRLHGERLRVYPFCERCAREATGPELQIIMRLDATGVRRRIKRPGVEER